MSAFRKLMLSAAALAGNTLLFGEMPLSVVALSPEEEPDELDGDDLDLSEEEPEVVTMVEKLQTREEDFAALGGPSADLNTMDKADKKKYRQAKSDIPRLKEKIGKKAKSPELQKKYGKKPAFGGGMPGMGGGAGGMPGMENMDEMMKDPKKMEEMMEMLKNMMGGKGGGKGGDDPMGGLGDLLKGMGGMGGGMGGDDPLGGLGGMPGMGASGADPGADEL